MTDSVGDVRVVLAGVAEQIGSAHHHAGVARARITDAVSVLGALSAEHPEPLVPDQLRRAGDELDRGLGLIGGLAAAVADIDARL